MLIADVIVLVVLSIFLWQRKSKGNRTWIDNLFGSIQKILLGIPLSIIGILLLIGLKGADNTNKTSGVIIYGGLPIPVSGNLINIILIFIVLIGGGYLLFYGLWLFGKAIVNRIKGKKYYI
jgi:hypothetical protein